MSTSLEAIRPELRPMMEQHDLKRYLPHRFPFLLLDRITDYEPNKWARGIKNVAGTEPLLTRYGDAHYSFGMIVESIGQLAIALINISKHVASPSNVLLGSLADVELRRPVREACQLRLYAEIVNQVDNATVFAGRAEVNGEIVVSVGNLIVVEQQGRSPQRSGTQ